MPRLKSRFTVVSLVCLLALVVLYSSIESLSQEDDYISRFKLGYGLENVEKPIVGQNIDNDPRHSFWNAIFSIFDESSVNVSDISKAIMYVDKNDQKSGPSSKEVLLSKAKIDKEVIEEMKSKHALVTSKLPKKLDKYTFDTASNGIVLIGGGRFSWLSFLSLKALRKAGSVTPVEIIMPQHDDFVTEQEFCTSVLPKMNAKCVVLPDVLGANVMNNWGRSFANYQFKSLALMVSSFQNVLLLDSDNIVLQNPDKLFESKLFKDNGMVLWPDYWKRTISPVFYDISGSFVNEKKRARYNRFPLALDSTQSSNILPSESDESEAVPYHDLEGTIPDLSTESGQVLINKATHSCTLLLSMYYNMFGPDLYYKLFSLGEQGEGDKDTFPAAATVCKDSFYQVKSFIKTFGYLDSTVQFQGVAMGQKDALVDFEKFQNLVEVPSKSKEMKAKSIPDQIKELQKLEIEQFGEPSGPLFAVHCNYPKLDPIVLMERDDLYDKEAKRLKYRIYGGLSYDDPNIKDKTIDFEYDQWKNIEKVLCEEYIDFPHFKNQEMEEVCMFVRNQVKYLHENPIDS